MDAAEVPVPLPRADMDFDSALCGIGLHLVGPRQEELGVHYTSLVDKFVHFESFVSERFEDLEERVGGAFKEVSQGHELYTTAQDHLSTAQDLLSKSLDVQHLSIVEVRKDIAALMERQEQLKSSESGTVGLLAPTSSPVSIGHFESNTEVEVENIEIRKFDFELEMVADKGNEKGREKDKCKEKDKVKNVNMKDLWGDLFGDDESQRALNAEAEQEMWGIRGYEGKYKEDNRGKVKDLACSSWEARPLLSIADSLALRVVSKSHLRWAVILEDEVGMNVLGGQDKKSR